MSIHPSILKESQNYSTSGFRSNQKLHQYAVHEGTAPPYQAITSTKTSLQHWWDKKQKWGHQTLHWPRNADGWLTGLAQVFPYQPCRSKGHLRIPLVHGNATQNQLGLRMDQQQSAPAHPVNQASHRVTNRALHAHPSRPKRPTKMPHADSQPTSHCTSHTTHCNRKETNPHLSISRASPDEDRRQKDPS